MKWLKNNPNLLLVILLILWCLLNVVQGIYTELANDEAYYWVISQQLEFGYYDHPPLFAPLIQAGVALMGDNELGIRLLSILLQPLYLYLFWSVVRPENYTFRSALTYFALAFSIPLLQLFGFIVTPDTSLMFCTALVLWTYKKFSENDKNILWALALALCAALLMYAKYHGLLILLFIVLSNLKLLRNYRFWVIVGVALMLYIPHLHWQSEHDWVSFRYHLTDRTNNFEWENLWLYIANFIGTFNPFLVFLFLILVVKIKSEKPVERALKFITWGFLGFFLWSTTKYHVQPQWLIPVCFPLLYFVLRGCEKRPQLQRYIWWVGGIFGILIIAMRIFAMTYTGDAIKLEVFNNKEYNVFAEELAGTPFIADGNYVLASKLRFYGHNPSYARPCIYSRSSHYEFRDMDTHLYGKKVAVEISDRAHNTLGYNVIDTMFLRHKIWQYDIFYDTVSFYIPTRYVSVECALPSKVLTEQDLPLDITIVNPYDFDIPLGTKDAFELVVQIRTGRFEKHDYPIVLKSTVLPAKGTIREYTRLIIPLLPTGDYKIGFALQRWPYGSWFNSPLRPITIINPKSRS